MKASALPQVVLAKLVDMDARVAELMAQAHEAESRVAYARSVINGKDNSVSAEEFARERDAFEATFAAAKLAKERAEVQRRVLTACKAWVESLAPDSKLLLVQPAASDLDLAALRARLAGLREELRKLTGTPPAASDIGERIAAHVAALAAKALPLVRGFAQGQQLDVKWPTGSDANRNNGVGFSATDGNALLLFAALFPHELSNKLILQAVAREQPLSASAHAARRRELEHAIDEISYAVAALLDKAGAPPDALMAPWHVLGVRIGEVSEGAAAA